MKLILCTLAVCLSILASVFTTKELLRAEGKKIRSSIPKALTEPMDAAGHTESLVQKLDAINSQLGTLNRRLTSVEDLCARQRTERLPHAAAGESPALSRSTVGLTATLARLDAVPGHLAELTTYLDQSFGHLEKTVTDAALPQQTAETLEGLTKKIDAIDSYFTPLYGFLGLSYNPADADLLAAYPSVDVRINELFLQLQAVQKDLAFVRSQVTPYTVEPTKHPR